MNDNKIDRNTPTGMIAKFQISNYCTLLQLLVATVRLT
jgi:hypothetical protein